MAETRGVVLNAEGRFEEAVREERRAIGILESISGPSSIDIAESANNAAVYLHNLGRNEEAETLMHRALAIFSELAGEDSGRVAFTSLNEGEILTALGRFDAARAALAKARAIVEVKDGSSFGIGYLRYLQGRLELAQGNARGAVSLLEDALSRLGTQDRVVTAEARFALAQALWQSPHGDRKRARDLERSASEGIASEPAAVGLAREIAAWQREHAPVRVADRVRD